MHHIRSGIGIFKKTNMKNIFLTPLVLISSVAHGQITVGNNDFTPIGSTFIMAFDTATRQPGGAGVNQNWNFSDLQVIFSDSTLVSDPADTPYPSFFPTSNTAFQSPSGSLYYQYFNNDITGFYLHGMVFASGTYPDVSRFSPPAKYFQWPMNYLDTNSCSYVYVSTYTSLGPFGVDTSKYIAHFNDQNYIDGWGQLTTPLGTFDCLRQRKIQERDDSIWFFSSQTGAWSLTHVSSDTAIIYDWLSNSSATGFILAEISYSQTYNMYSGVYWMKGAMVGIGEHNNNVESVSAYPNPASEILYVETNRAAIIELYDMHGKLLGQWKENTLQHALNISRFPNGFYMLSVRDEENKFPPARAKIIIGN